MAGLNSKIKIGVFGGTFDPPHIGHLILASECLSQLNLDQVLWVLTPFPPHKSELMVSPVAQRLLLLESAVTAVPGFALSRVDIERPPPHYAVDTVEILKSQNPHACLVYLMGLDSLRDLPSWHEPGLFIQSVDQIGVVTRPNILVDIGALEGMFSGIREKLSFVKMPEIEISSRDIRERIKARKPYRFFLPEKVFGIIEENKYYLP